MAKKSVQYVCSECGDTFSKWSGKCPTCGAWSSLREFRVSKSSKKAGGHGLALRSATLAEIDTKNTQSQRILTNIEPLDEVLGGGLVPGSVILIAGEPGIGKSTILLQVAAQTSRMNKVLYVSGEESAHQIALRAERLESDASQVDVASSTSTDDTVASIEANQHDIVVVDSIQTLSLDSVDSAAGNVSQISQSAHALIAAAKATNTCLIFVGHVTKEGSIAGPKILEHIVDVVLNLEGDRYGGFKVLRGAKNRFGSTNEIAIFEMHGSGLRPVDNPSKALLAERQVSDGSVVLATMEGTRPLLVEVQALVNKTSFGYPKRTASGIDYNRLNLLIAVLNRRTKLDLSQDDVYVNIVGGIKIAEPAADLAVCLAIASAATGMVFQDDAVVFGEVGLAGEIRHVPSIDQRRAEAKKLGFKAVIGPPSDVKSAEYASFKTMRDALNTLLKK